MFSLLITTCSLLCVSDDDSTQRFGYRQIDQLIDDRPEMNKIFDRNHPFVEWLSLELGGTNAETRVYWNSEEPVTGFSAEHSPRYAAYPAHIRITAGNALSGLDKWIVLAFELHNLRNTREFADLQRRAATGRLPKEQFVKECVELEIDAVIETERLLREKLEVETLRQSRLFAEYQIVIEKRRMGTSNDTGRKHRAVYEAAFEHARAWGNVGMRP